MPYTKSTDFAVKDSLLTGNPAKVVKGAEIDNEFNNIATADALNLKRDGTSVASANIPMGGFKFTNLGAATGNGQAVTYERIQTSRIDNTTGALMTVGAFGLGAGKTGLVTPIITDANTVSQEANGFWSVVDGTSTMTLPTGLADIDGSLINHVRASVGASAQAYQVFFHAGTRRMFYRVATSNTWGNWISVAQSSTVQVTNADTTVDGQPNTFTSAPHTNTPTGTFTFLSSVMDDAQQNGFQIGNVWGNANLTYIRIKFSNVFSVWTKIFTSLGDNQVTVDTGTLGFGTGSGGTVTQATSKATGVTLNKPTGQITMNAAALAANTAVSFTLTNDKIGANDVPKVVIKSGATAGAYILIVDAVVAGSCRISVRNMTGGSLSEALVLQFNIEKGAIA